MAAPRQTGNTPFRHVAGASFPRLAATTRAPVDEPVDKSWKVRE
jgi:hypothetical protein